MENVEIAATLRELADLLEIQGANPFKVRAYRNALRTIAGLTRSLASMIAAGEDLTALPAIGKDIAGYIAELIETGRLRRLEDVTREVPRSLVQLVQLDGVGPKKAKRLYDDLGVDSVDALERAIDRGEVATLEGFGARSIEKIRQSIGDFRKRQGRYLLSEADELVAPLVEHMKGAPGVTGVEVAGSYRRRKETIGDIDLLVRSSSPGREVMDHFTGFAGVDRVEGAGDTRGTVVLRSGLSVDLRVVPPKSWGAALHYFTGSKEHNVEVRKLGQKRGLRINEYGVFRIEDGDDGDGGPESGERVGGRTEAEVFEAVGMPWVPPEIRENRGELAFRKEADLPGLVSVSDIEGDLHMHSTWSDGKVSIADMAAACRERGYRYLAISDHSQAVTVAGGLTPRRVRQQWEEIGELRDGLEEISLLRSLEVDILRDGSLDMPDEILEGLDLVLVSVHSAMDMTKAGMTKRVIKALQHPAVDILCHPTGRKLNRREPYEIDMEEVLQAAAELDVAVEINANPRRLDLSDVHAYRAGELGVKVAVNTDAHTPKELDYMSYGVDQARRAWLEKDQILNCLPLGKLRKWLDRGPA